MFESITRSWELTRVTFRVMQKERELLLFPLLGGIFSLLFLIAMLVPTIILAIVHGAAPAALNAVDYAILFVTYLGLAFIATFFNVAVVYTAKTHFSGKQATFKGGMRFAFSRIRLILAWSLLSASVGLLFRILDDLAERLGGIGEIIAKMLIGLLGFAWSIVTIFVVPVMVYEGKGPIDAVKSSTAVLKKTWGESLARYLGFGMVQFLLALVGFIIGIVVTIGLYAVGGGIGVLIGLFLLALYFIALWLVFSTATMVYNTALYEFARTGKVPQGFSATHMDGAFRRIAKK